MSTPTWGLDPKSRRITVYYEGSSTIREGMPLCYSYLTTKNWLGVSSIDFTTTASSVTESETTDEGDLNEGKFIRVENPAASCDVNGTPATGYKTITGGGTDFTDLQVGMFVTVTGTDITNGTYEITVKAADVITLGGMAVATGNTADVTVKSDNLQNFAGVVAGADHDGETGPKAIDIYVANGAIVPVKTVLTATVVGRTILCINAGVQTLGNPTTDIDDFGRDTLGDTVSRPVAIAQETIAAAGLCLAKLDPNVFLYQGGSDDQELQVAAGTVNTALNKSLVDFKNTDGHCTSWLWRTLLSGAGGGASRGVYRFDVNLAAALGEHTYGVDVALDITGDLGDVWVAPLHLTVRSRSSDPDLSSTAVYAIKIDWNLTQTTTTDLTNPPGISALFYVGADYTQPLYFLYANDMASIAGYLSTGTAEFSATDVMIPIKLSGTTYYLCAFADSGL